MKNSSTCWWNAASLGDPLKGLMTDAHITALNPRTQGGRGRNPGSFWRIKTTGFADNKSLAVKAMGDEP
jgi:hypothetical protein